MIVPAIFSDHMVLQRGVKLPVWGRADAGEKVKIEIAGKSTEATADAGGRWRADLPALDAQGPHTMIISGSNRIEIKDVLVGEVWLGSGQSNMAMSVKSAKDFAKEQAAAALPGIRMFKTENNNAATAQEDCKGVWTVCSPEIVGGFSATAFLQSVLL